MDAETLAVSLKLAKKRVLPQVNSGDAGATLVVDNNGAWAKGEVVTSAISVSEHTLVVTAAE